MKTRYANTFEYGQKLAKYLIGFAVVICLASVLFMPKGSIVQTIAAILGMALIVATIYVTYKYCRCPHCGKHIVAGVFAVKTCPACRRSLVTGKKIRK